MNSIKAIYCRTVQAVLRAALPVLPYREPEIFRSCAELHTVFTKKNIQRVLIVTDEGIVHRKLHELGIAAGVCKAEESDAQAAAAFIQAIRELNARMGIPDHLEGIREEDISVMASHAEKEANPLYPVPRLMTKEELTFFYRQIAAGREVRHGKRAS